MTVRAEAVTLTVAGERVESFDDLFARESPRLVGYCFRLVADRELAADIAQEAFARLFARWIGVQEPRAYLYRIATNLAQRAWRDRARMSAEEPPDATDPGVGNVAVRLAVYSLPHRFREVIFLRYFADLPLVEVAAVVGKPAGTVKWLLSEGRSRLERILEDPHA